MVNNNIEEINGVWCVSGDTGTNPHILEKGLKWDNTFQKVLDIVGSAKGRIAIDVGAFIGDSTKWFVDAGFDTFAFEPYPDAFECLCKNLSNVQAFQWAIGFDESIGLMTEYGGNLGARGLPKGETTTKSLDEIFAGEKCGLLKIDTEGFDSEIIKMLNLDEYKINNIRFEIWSFDETCFKDYNPDKWKELGKAGMTMVYEKLTKYRYTFSKINDEDGDDILATLCV